MIDAGNTVQNSIVSWEQTAESQIVDKANFVGNQVVDKANLVANQTVDKLNYLGDNIKSEFTMIGNQMLDALNSAFSADSAHLKQQQADLTSGTYLLGGLLVVSAVVYATSN